MTTATKSYFRYHLRSQWKMLLCIVLIALVITASAAADQRYVNEAERYAYGSQASKVYYYCTLETSLFVLIACSYILPVTEFSVFKKRRNLDCFYGLPISRRQMGMVHYTTGLICLIVSYTCAYLANFLFLLRYPEGFNYAPLLGYYFLSLGLGVCAYSINVFVFNRANSTGDGIWFMILFAFAVPAVVDMCNTVSRLVYEAIVAEAEYSAGILTEAWKIPNCEMSSCFGALIDIKAFYSHEIEKHQRYTSMHIWGDRSNIAWLLFLAASGIASMVGFAFSFGKGRAEKTGEVSDSWFGFKLMIPIYAVWLTMNVGLSLFALIATFCGYLIYRKGFHLKRSDWIVMGALVLLNLLMYISILPLAA